MAMAAVGKAAMDMIEEVRRQFKEIPALKSALSIMHKYEGKDQKDWSADDIHILKLQWQGRL